MLKRIYASAFICAFCFCIHTSSANNNTTLPESEKLEKAEETRNNKNAKKQGKHNHKESHEHNHSHELDSCHFVEVEQIVVSSSRNETTRREAASIVNVASRTLFENTASNSAAEALNFKPGLRVEYNCSNCGVPQLRINGLDGQYSQILLDSRPIFSSLAGVYGLEQLPESMIERVEVVRGGGSALFGSSAIAGAVNIITREPKTSSVNLSNNSSFFEGGGSDINTSLNASVVSKNNKAGIYIFSMIRDRSAYDRNGDGFSEIPQLNSNTVGFRGFYRVSPSSRFTLEYHHLNEFRRGGDSLQLQPHEVEQAEQLRHRINGGSLKYDYSSPNMRSRLSAYLSAQNIDRQSFFGSKEQPNAYGKTFDATIVGGVQYTYDMYKCLFLPAQLTAGFEYTNNYLNDEMISYNRILAQLSDSYGVFVQNEWKSDKFGLIIGGRLDKHNIIQNPIFSPRLSIRYAPIRSLTFRTSYSSGYRAPQAYDEDLHVAAVGGKVSIITISPDLRPEYSHSITLSADYFKSWYNLTFNATAEGFYTNLFDVFVLPIIGHDEQGNIIRERRNADGAIIAGVNFEARLNYANKLSIDGGFTYQISRYKEPFRWSEDPNIAPQKQMFRSPNTYGYLSLTYNPWEKFSISANGTYTGSMLVQHNEGYINEDREVRTPNFFDIGLKFAYDFKFSGNIRLQINAGVKNILDQFQSDLDVGAERDASYIYGPVFPRTYFFGIKFTI